jgi:hypothetical protein
MINAFKILVEKLEGMRPGMNFRETGWEGVDWMNLAPDRDQWRALINTVMNFYVP